MSIKEVVVWAEEIRCTAETASRYSRYGRDNHLVRNIIIISASAVIALAVAGVLIWYFCVYQPTQTSQNDVSSTAPSVIESTQSTESTVSQQTAANSYETLYPDMYVPQVEKIGAAEGEKSVYLTFNNAPSAQTDKLLDVLGATRCEGDFLYLL